MKEIEEIEEIKKELKSVLINLKSKFSVEEIIYSDSITVNSIVLNKKEFKMLLNYSYFVEEDLKQITKKTRANLFYLSNNKIFMYNEKKPEKLDFIFSNCLKLYYLFKAYKNTIEKIEIHLSMKFNSIYTKQFLVITKDFEEANKELAEELNKLSKEDYKEYDSLKTLLKEEEQRYLFMKYERTLSK
ncbi:hypothetical protein PT447_00240 [Aliarcobacter butzleri]|uniref:hypothetical protein n=1 Tax=Aliarcobacter butzleri TaxID=28197 RepID=UPI0024DE957F|nr:hypothetical protein [Aliarcobacter butzleri]MDK2063348.1 hypothetical protein [Aliarcobacter butzleri]